MSQENESLDLSSGVFGLPLSSGAGPDNPEFLMTPGAQALSNPGAGTRAIASLDADDEDDDDFGETLSERIIGLNEMFPEKIRGFIGSLASFSVATTKTLFTLGKGAMWIAASSASILILPVMFESERAQLQEQQLQQQRQILLGPNAAVSGIGSSHGLLPGAMPPGMMQMAK